MFSALITSSVPIVAGPMMIGIAIGTTAISCFCVGFGVSLLFWMRFTAERKSSAPAPTRNASSVIPNMAKMCEPKKYRTKQMMLIEIAMCFTSWFLSLAL